MRKAFLHDPKGIVVSCQVIMNKPLYRSTQNKMVGGVCGGLAEYLGVSPTAIRILSALSVPFTGLISLSFYLLAMVLLPEN